MNIYDSEQLSIKLKTTRNAITSATKKARYKKLNFIKVRGEKFYFQKKSFGKGFEYCSYESLNITTEKINVSKNKNFILIEDIVIENLFNEHKTINIKLSFDKLV